MKPAEKPEVEREPEKLPILQPGQVEMVEGGEQFAVLLATNGDYWLGPVEGNA